FALNCQGYFQKLNALGGIELTRDGRFQIDKDGSMRALDGKRILSAAGIPIQLPIVPQDPDRQVKVSPMGDITVYDPASGEALPAGRIGVATESGSLVGDVDIKQGYVEDSNVMLQEEYVAIMPLRRQFEANRQMFILRSDSLSRMIQELGRGQ